MVECSGLEGRYAAKSGVGGSNPPLSASCGLVASEDGVCREPSFREDLLSQFMNRGDNPLHPLTALFFTVMVTVVGYWAGKVITPLQCQAQPDFPPGFSIPRRFSCPTWL